MAEVKVPFQTFFDTSGLPLDDGYVYIGTAGLNPQTNALSLYWDEDLTIPAAQPIRTINGYFSRSGAPDRLYSSALEYSITVRNKNLALVYSSLNSGSPAEAGVTLLNYTSGAGGLGLTGTSTQAATGDVIRTTYFDSNKNPSTGVEWQYTGTTTLGKAGTVNADGYVYDADGKKFQNISAIFILDQWGAVPDNSTASGASIAAAIAFADDIGGARLFTTTGTYLSDKINMKPGVSIWGQNPQDTIFDFTSSSDNGFEFAEFAHGSGLFSLRVINAPQDGVAVLSTGGAGLGEAAYIDLVQSYNNGRHGFNFAGDSAPLMIGHIHPHGNNNYGVQLDNESSSLVQILYVSGDENGDGLVGIEDIGSGSVTHIIGWKAERRTSGTMDNIFTLTNAVGGYVHIGSGSYQQQDASAPNAIVRVASGSSINLQVDPVTPLGSISGADYTYGIENLITGITRTVAQIKNNPYQTVKIIGDQAFSGAAVVLWHNFRNAIAGVSSGNTLRFNHASDGASTTTNTEWYNNTTNIMKLSNSGGLSITSNLRVGSITAGASVITGTGSPEGSVTAPVGSIFLRQDGGASTTLYVKESGTGNTGWVAK